MNFERKPILITLALIAVVLSLFMTVAKIPYANFSLFSKAQGPGPAPTFTMGNFASGYTHTCSLDKIFNATVYGGTSCGKGMLCITQGSQLVLAKDDGTQNVLDVYTEGRWTEYPDRDTTFLNSATSNLLHPTAISAGGKDFLLASRTTPNFFDSDDKNELLLFEIIDNKLKRHAFHVQVTEGGIGDYEYDADNKRLLTYYFENKDNGNGDFIPTLLVYIYDLTDPLKPKELTSITLDANYRDRFYRDNFIFEVEERGFENPPKTLVKVYDLTDLKNVKTYADSYQGQYSLGGINPKTRQVVFMGNLIGREKDFGAYLAPIENDHVIRFDKGTFLSDVDYSSGGAVSLVSLFTNNSLIAYLTQDGMYVSDINGSSVTKVAALTHSNYYRSIQIQDDRLFLADTDGLLTVKLDDLNNVTDSSSQTRWWAQSYVAENQSLFSAGKLLSSQNEPRNPSNYLTSDTLLSMKDYPGSINATPIKGDKGTIKTEELRMQYGRNTAEIVRVIKKVDQYYIDIDVFQLSQQNWKFLKNYQLPLSVGLIRPPMIIVGGELSLDFAKNTGRYGYLMITNKYASQTLTITLDMTKPEQEIKIANVQTNPEWENAGNVRVENVAESQGYFTIATSYPIANSPRGDYGLPRLTFYDTKSTDGKLKRIGIFADKQFTVTKLLGGNGYGFIAEALRADPKNPGSYLAYSVITIDPKTYKVIDWFDDPSADMIMDDTYLYSHRGYTFQAFAFKPYIRKSGDKPDFQQDLAQRQVMSCRLPTGHVKIATLQGDSLYVWRWNYIERYIVKPISSSDPETR